MEKWGNSMNLPFTVARETATNLGNAFAKVRDENAIERILSDAMSTGSPEVLQNSIGKILSQVSPERQGMAIQYLQNAYNNVQQRQERERLEAKEFSERSRKEEMDRQAAQEAGYTFGVPPAVAAQQVKEKAKGDRLSQYGLGPKVAAKSEQVPSVASVNQTTQTAPTNQTPESVFKSLTDDQLVVASGAPDREVSEPAKAELQRRQKERELNQKRDSKVFENELARSSKVIERAEQIAEQIPQKRTAVNLMKDAVANKNLGFFSRDSLAEITGIEGFRSPEGAIFKTAGKEYFLGNISRAGARPNQWIEQQIADMMAKIGRSTEANLSVLRALENELDLDEARVKFTDEISDRLRAEGDYGQGKLGTLVNKEMSKYAEAKQDILFNDLRAIKAIAENEPQKFRKVEKGTQVSDYMVQALLKQFNNDPKKAREEAKKLGYEF